MKGPMLPFLAGLLLLSISGCATLPSAPQSRPSPVAPEIARARNLFEAGRLADALIALVDIGHHHPNDPALVRLQEEVMDAITERRAVKQRTRRDSSISRAMLESEEDALLPETFGLRRHIQGNDSTHVRELGPMSRVLEQTLTLHFDAVSLAEIITYLGEEKQINLIADPGLDTPPVTIHAEELTLEELFEYLSRNMDITFNFGKGVIWVTAAEEERSSTPLYTRLYRLRNGLPTQYLTDGGVDDAALLLVDAIGRFVPLPEGGDILFDGNTQILLVKNSERNLGMVDRLVEAMDITQPQVLIEARFVSTNVSDLRELGVDWLLQSDLELSDENGRNRTQLNEGAAISFGDSTNAGQGFTGTFTGILTDPQFRAVLHALEVKGDARTLSAPKVIAVNNRPSFIRIGRDLAYVSDVSIERETFGTGEDREELLIRDPVVETLETGYQLEATPSVGLNRRDINLRLRPEIVELIRFREINQSATRRDVDTNPDVPDPDDDEDDEDDDDTRDAEDELPFAGIEFPELARSLLETEVVVQTGETVVMGGLMRHREQKDVRSIPLLGSLPIIGKLFSRTSIDQTKDNLLIFVTATLISKRGEDMVPVEWNAPAESETRGRFIENNGPMDESISD